MVSVEVLTAAPDEAELLPEAANALLAALRAESAATEAAVGAALLLVEETEVPATALVLWVPDAAPPEVLTQICFSISGSCQYCGATSMTT